MADVAPANAPQANTADRAAIVAELESLTDAAAAEPAAAAPAPEAPAEGAAPAPADKPTEPAPDAETSKRLQVIQRAEERSRAALKTEREAALAEIKQAREDIERMQTEWKPKLESFERMKARAKYEPAAVLAELGLTDDDFEIASKDLYLRSKAGAADPKAKAEVAKTARERAHEDRLTRIERENAELKQQLTTREQRAVHERAVSEYLDSAIKAANDETPILRTLVEKNPTKARSELERIAHELAEQHGAPVTAAEVALAYEERRRAELEELGASVPAKKKAAAPAAPSSRPGAVLPANAPAGTTPVPKKQTREEAIAATLRDLESGNVPAE